ncbi:hypothetical protein [Curtobacterium flaccumfaciens]|uniref:hypothetical protein n=1 Tax=Curtobacterium flaccumfaciens TaxID=2035 RepID=UPI00217CC208|nr:hypothetical protein [Curtobacterium flaccumfaciens]MCS6555696.1 hypothetical protein [Curtobacterium flaccumfaciens]
MSNEPPGGDEMQRMLAGMRQQVVWGMHDKPRPASARRRVGLIVALIAVLGIGTASGSVALGLVPTPFAAAPAPVPSSAPPTPAPTGSPSAARITPTPAPADTTATIPGACTDAVPAADAPRLFGSLEITQFRPQVPGGRTDYYIDPEIPFKEDAELVCSWTPGGTSEGDEGLFLEMGTADRDVLQARLRVVADKDWTCTDTLGGRSCQHTETAMYYSDRVETTHTFFVRGDTWISITQSNVPTDRLLKALVQQTWTD